MNNTCIRAVVFDMDGLMFNTEDVYDEVGTRLLARRGCRFTPELKREMMGLTPQASFEKMIRWCGLKESWRTLAEESNRLFVELLPERIKPLPGLMPLLDALEAGGIPKAICTSSPAELAAACLNTFRLQKRFQFVLTAEDVRHGKPHPEVYLTAAQRFGIPPPEMLVLEDSENGCRAAVAAGAFAVAVPAAHSRHHDFRGARMILSGLSDPLLYQLLGLSLPQTATP